MKETGTTSLRLDKGLRIIYTERMKQCGKCKEHKALSEFSKNKARKDGYQNTCRGCKGVAQRRYYAENKDAYLGKIMETRKVRKRAAREFVIDYLKEHPCVDCGETDVIVLEFDHVRSGKTANVSELVCEGYSLNRIAAEIAMCEVRCANDHRRVTLKRAGIDFTEFL